MSATATTRELVIEHSAEEGTTLHGTTRADDVYGLLRSHGWLFRKTCGDYKLQASEWRPFRRGKVKTTIKALTEHLGDVTVRLEVDKALGRADEAEAAIEAAAEARADRLEASAARLANLSDAARKAADRVFDAIPFGQPLLVGHHSYKADKRRRERAWNSLGRSFELGRVAAQREQAAQVAAERVNRRHAPVTVANRIERLEAEHRKITRRIGEDDAMRRLSEQAREKLIGRTGWRLLSDESREDYAAESAWLQGQIDYWTEVRRQQIADGVTPGHSKETINPGDFVKARGQLYYVLRANPKTVTVPSWIGGDYTGTTPYQEITEVIKPEDPKHAVCVRALRETNIGEKTRAAIAKRFPNL